MRHTLGPTLQATKADPATDAPAPPPAEPVGPVLADIAITIGQYDPVAWTLPVSLPPYSLKRCNRLMEVRVYLAPVGSALPADADSWVASAFPFQVADVSDIQAGAEFDAPLPDAPVGADQFGQVILSFQV